MSEPMVPAPTMAAPMAPSQVPSSYFGEEEDGGGANLLAIAWAGRWLILLFTILGGAAAWAYLGQLVPRYTSVAQIYVQQSLPMLLSRDTPFGGMTASHLYTQAELIRSTSVLAAALESPELASARTLQSATNPLGMLRERLQVQVGDQSDLITISIELEDAVEAGTIVNAVVDAYIAKYAEQRKTSVVDVLTILRNEKRKRDAELEERRAALEDFRETHATLAVQTGEDNPVTQLYSALAAELNATQIELLEAKTRYNRATKMLENPDQAEFLAELARSEYGADKSADLDAQIARVEENLVSLRSEWGDGYPAVKLLSESLDRLKERQGEKQRSVVTAYVDTLRQNYELLAQRRDELQRAYDRQFELAAEVSNQAAELESLQEAYARAATTCDIIDERIKEVDLSDEVGAMNISIVETAGIGFQTFPEPAKTLSVGLAFGAMLGFGLAWLRDFLDQRLKSIEEIAATLRVPIAGAIPLLASTKKGESRQGRGMLVATEPRSVAAESIRTLRTSLHFGIAGPQSKVFVITSPAPGDGKSTVASNLAIAMAQSNQRVLLIDSDLRKPRQAEIFSASSRVGLTGVLQKKVTTEEAIFASTVPNLDLLLCGDRPGNPVELLNNGVFPDVIAELCEEYDRIVIDSPPVMPVADARLIATFADCTLLVLRAERSTRRLSVAARDELMKVNAPRLGVVVNAAPPHSGGYGSYSSGYRGYGYGAYGSVAYGYEEEENAENGRRRLSRSRRGSKRDQDLVTAES